MKELIPYQVYYNTDDLYYLLVLNEMEDYPGIYYCLNLDGTGDIFTSDAENIPESFNLVTGFDTFTEAIKWINKKEFISNILLKIERFISRIEYNFIEKIPFIKNVNFSDILYEFIFNYHLHK